MRESKEFLTRVLVPGFCLVLCLAAGCGGDEGEGGPPRISNLFFGPTSTFVGWHNGEVGVSVSMDYADSDGDLAFVRMSTRPCGEDPVQHVDVAPVGITGSTEGVVWLAPRVTTACPAGTYLYEFSAVDRKGHQSNTLEASFTLTPVTLN